MRQPEPSDPKWPRYSNKPFPPYRFVPGQSPHPRRDPKGHEYGQPEPHVSPFPPEQWNQSAEYLYGIDLYNFAYWWECHEMLEAIWHAVGHTTQQGQFLQGVIQVSAANLRRFIGNAETAKAMAGEGLRRMQDITAIYMGVDVPAFTRDVRDYFEDRNARPALILLR